MVSMGLWIAVASALTATNVALLAVLMTVWLRNYRAFRTGLVAGLVVFSAVMLLENAVAIHYFFGIQMLYAGDPGVQRAVAVLRALQALALGFLTDVTVK